jgi:rhodanese-related sulfurtransferase
VRDRPGSTATPYHLHVIIEGCRLSRSNHLLALCVILLVLVACQSPAASPAAQGSPVRQVAAAEAVAMLADLTVIDVRTPEEYASGHITNAINIPVEATDFEERVAGLDPAGSYLLYCRSGRRSAMAAEIMAEAGFSDLVDAGGLEPLVVAGAHLDAT